MKEKTKVKTPTTKEQENLLGEFGLQRYYKKIEKVLKEYMDMREEYYPLVSIWIMGTYLHKQFSAYPYLFFNAMKGSGKTRILRIISTLAKNGKFANSMTEAVLFRTAYGRTFCIDELESVNAKGKENLKELLNSAYKKGAVVERMAKRKGTDGEEYFTEEFKVYCPIAIANIWGMDDVLGDRCLTIRLEKSVDEKVTSLIENFDNEMQFKTIKGGLIGLTEKLQGDSMGLFDGVISEWNDFSKKEKDIKDVKDVWTSLFVKIKEAKITGRDLELFFPMFIIADICGGKILEDLIKISKKIVKEKRLADREDNRDVQIYEFVSKYANTEFVSVAKLVEDFKSFIDIDEKWINSRWLGRGLRRLVLVTDERKGQRREVRLDIEKAKEKILMFREPDEIDFKELDGVLG